MPLIPHRFLVRVAYPCRHVQGIPHENEDQLLDLPESCRLDNYAAMDEAKNFADVRVAWNEFGLGIQVEVKGKVREVQADEARAASSDGLTLWIDTRDSRTSHRASRYCHQFHILPAGGGPDREDPVFVHSRINRAQQDAPPVSPQAVLLRSGHTKGGYLIEAFLPAAVLNGFDPDQNPRLGIYYQVRDTELGEQVLAVGSEFPYREDPSLWGVLDLVR